MNIEMHVTMHNCTKNNPDECVSAPVIWSRKDQEVPPMDVYLPTYPPTLRRVATYLTTYP